MATQDTSALGALKHETAKLCAHALFVLQAYKGYIASIPSEVAASLPAMPGIDGDYADQVSDLLRKQSKGADRSAPVFGETL